ncbi:MAG: GAF domain-containing protein, partial [Planctomycetota bacterium]
PVDLVLAARELPDGDGLDLVAELSRVKPATATVLLQPTADFDAARAALRAGADDLLTLPLDPAELPQRLDAALDRRTREKAHDQRVRRLRRLCRKLTEARDEVSKQVDILCNDLVTAYQELACQMQNAVQSSEYADHIAGELGLEPLLRKTLEHLMAKLGPANAAIFLPSTMDEYSLGGYVNYDRTKESADLLLQSLADGLAPRVAQHEELVHLADPNDLDRWLGPDAASLSDAGLVAAPCMNGDECLAVLTLFRDLDQPFTDEHLDRLSSLAPLLGEALEKIIRVHHRTVFHDPQHDTPDAPDDDGSWDVHFDDEDDDALPF